LKIVADVF